MSTMDIVRAWKDEDYRSTLAADQQATLPTHPSGIIEFGTPQLEDESLFGPEENRCKYSQYTHLCTKNNGHCK